MKKELADQMASTKEWTSATEAAQALGVDLSSGIEQASIAARRAQYGYNEIPEKKTFPVLRFLKKFWGPSAWIMELILGLSVVLHNYKDLYVVSGLLVVNAVLSFIQENKASAAVDLLRSRLQVNARVLRDRHWGLVPARELLPGDVIRLRSGDLVPADALLIEGTLEVDQSMLTGESIEVAKTANEGLFASSIVRRGEAQAFVTAIGTRTYFGRTAELVQLARPKLHAEIVVSRVVRVLFVIVIALLTIAVIFAAIRGMPLLNLLPLLLVLLLGAVPVALPVMFTVSMAVTSQQLAKKGVLVTRLSAGDDAATMDVLCVDKTGTITTNQLDVSGITAFEDVDENQVLLLGCLASQEANHDPIDMAFFRAANARGLPISNYQQLSFIPFDASTRCTEATAQIDARQVHIIKGAVPAVLQRCNLDSNALTHVESIASNLAAAGDRVLAVAVEDAQTPMQLVGLVSLRDMPRADSKEFIAELNNLGVAVKMLTGDTLPIAREVAQQVELGSVIHKASEIVYLSQSDADKAAKITEESDGFAEIYPEGKYLVVKSLQTSGHVVGMTGDGVNDAPALRQAEVGIAVSSATDVAKGAASVVLMDEGLAPIVDLIKNGRMTYQRIATWIINKISRTILKTAFVVLAYLITGKLVISAFSMILMMFMTDFVKISLSTDNVRWSKNPETWNVMALTRVAAVMGVLMVFEALGLLAFGLRHLGLAENLDALYTFSFATLLFFALFSIFAVRERRHFWDSMPSRTMLLAIGADLVIGFLLCVVGIPGLQPLPITTTLFVVGYAMLFPLVVNDTIKCLVVKAAGISW